MAAKILSKLVGERRRGEGVGVVGGGVKTGSRHNTEVNTFIGPLTGHLLTFFFFFSGQTPRILSPSPPRVAGDICSARLRSLRPVFRRFQLLLCAVCSIVAKVTPDKDGTGDANAARLSRQRCGEGGGRLPRESSAPMCKHGCPAAKLIRALARAAQGSAHKGRLSSRNSK